MRRAIVCAGLAVAGCGGDVQRAAAPAPAGTLYLAGRDPGTLIRVDAATGAVTRREGVRELGGGDPPHMVAFTGGRLVTFALGRTSSFAPDLSDPRSLGEAWFYVPSATPGRVWNLLLRRGDPATQVNFRGVREVTVDGHVKFESGEPVPGWTHAAVSAGLVLSTRRGLELWDPWSAVAVRRLPGTFFVAARGALVATCHGSCRAAHVTDTRTGRHALIRVRSGFEGAFSPNGRLLALRNNDGLVVVDVERRRPILRVRTHDVRDDYKQVAWASSGWLFYSLGDGKLGAWRPGESARELPLTVGPFIDMTSD